MERIPWLHTPGTESVCPSPLPLEEDSHQTGKTICATQTHHTHTKILCLIRLVPRSVAQMDKQTDSTAFKLLREGEREGEIRKG